MVLCTCSCLKMPLGLWQLVQVLPSKVADEWHLLQVAGWGGMSIPVWQAVHAGDTPSWLAFFGATVPLWQAVQSLRGAGLAVPW